MAASLPDSYRRLAQYAARFAAGETVYEQGSVPGRCYVVLRGNIDFEVVNETGETEVVASAQEGELIGHVAAFTGRPTSATARAKDPVILLAVPVQELVTAFREAPELAIQLIHAFADAQAGPVPWRFPAVEDAAVDAAVVAEPGSDTDISTAAHASGASLPVVGDFDPTFFFVDSIECPVSHTVFDYLRVRTSAVRPISRDSDFFIRYRSLDPTYYSIIVCPTCGYAAYREDFDDVTEEECVALRAAAPERQSDLVSNVAGVRSTDDTEHVVRLALACYARRRPNERRRAALLHRLAWIERERGNEAAELGLLSEARDTYRLAFERDTNISDEGAMRAAYLIGDLTLRLGDAVQAARWFEITTRSPEARNQSGLVRMARDRLYDAHLLITEAAGRRSA